MELNPQRGSWWTCAQLNTAPSCWEQEKVLNEEERQRLQHLRHPQRRASFILGRYLARQLLRRVSPLSEADCSLHCDQHGRPQLTQAHDWDINISHAHHVVVVVASYGSRVGLDVEPLTRCVDWQNLAKRYCDAPEQAALAQAPDPRQFFLWYWCAKEAWLKREGGGIDRPLNEVPVRGSPPHHLSVVGSRLWALPCATGYACLCVAAQAPQQLTLGYQSTVPLPE